MNTILQKRIEEAAAAIAPFNRMSQKRDYFVKGATFALQNQWISVGEALPEDNELYFVAYKAMDRVLYSTGCYEADNKEWYVDGVGFNAEVTHWMMIPTINKEEK